MKNNPPKKAGGRVIGVMAGILLGGAVPPLSAGEFAYGLGYAGAYSSNVTRAPANERNDWIHSALGGFAYQERTIDVVARVLGQAEYRHYSKDTFGDESIFNFNGSMLWNISPQRFTWTVEDSYRQEQVDVTTVFTPANRTNVNVFSTGPDVYIRFAPVHTLALGARAGNVYTGRVDADNDRFSGTASWLYQSSSISTYSLNYQVLDVNYDNSTLNNGFTRQDLFLRGQWRPSRSRYILDLGRSDISRDRGNDLDGTLARFSWLRQLSPESAFGVSLNGEFSDTGTDVLGVLSTITGAPTAVGGAPGVTGGQIYTPPSLSTDVLTGDVYYAKRGEVFYTRRGSQVSVQIQASRQALDFETALLDREGTGGYLEVGYFYSGATTMTLFTRYTKTEFRDFVQRDTDRDSGLRLDYRLTRNITLGLEGRRLDRSSTNASLDFVENRATFTILYNSGPLFTPVRRI